MRNNFPAVLKQPITYSFAAPFTRATSISGVLSTCHILKECTHCDLLRQQTSRYFQYCIIIVSPRLLGKIFSMKTVRGNLRHTKQMANLAEFPIQYSSCPMPSHWIYSETIMQHRHLVSLLQKYTQESWQCM